MADKGNRTFLSDLVDPEVLKGMIDGKVESYIRVTPFATIDNTLVGQAGSTITVPFYGHIGNAVVVAEGDEIPVEPLTTSKKQYQVHKIGKGITLTDEAVLSGYGDPVGQAAKQLAQSQAQRVDEDAMDELKKADRHFIATGKLSYDTVVDAIDVFGEEWNSPKVMFISPKQVSTLRKDTNFISADKYGVGTNVVMYGEVGMISNTRIVPTNRVDKNADTYYPVASGTSGATTITDSNLATIKAGAIGGYEPKVGDTVAKLAADTYFINPIVRFIGEDEVNTGLPAITIFMKRDTMVEPSRDAAHAQTTYYATKHYTVALTNADEVCLLYAKA